MRVTSWTLSVSIASGGSTNMFLHTGLAVLVIVVGADGTVETDHELALAKATFAREFPDDAKDLRPVTIVEVVES